MGFWSFAIPHCCSCWRKTQIRCSVRRSSTCSTAARPTSWKACTGLRSRRTRNCARECAVPAAASSRARSCADWNHQTAFECSGLWDWDVVNDRLTWINDWCEHSQVAAFSGYGHEHLWSSRIHAEDLPAYREALTQHLECLTPPYDIEYRLRNRDDAWVWIQERGRVIERDSAGRALRTVGLCLDVDERHKSASALERSESRFAHAVWGASVGFWDHDLTTDSVHWWNDWCADADLH